MSAYRNEDGRVVEERSRRKHESGRRDGAGGEPADPVIAPTVRSGEGATARPGGAGKGDRFRVPPTVAVGRQGNRPGAGGSGPGTVLHREGVTAPSGGAGEEDRGDPKTQIHRPVTGDSVTDPMDDPPVGWLVVVAGPGKGHVATLGIGRNAVGRSQTERVSLDYGDRTISRTRHCTITYEPRGRTFHVGPGDGHNLTYVDDECVHETCELKPLAQVQMGATVLRFVPLCGPEFSWEDEPDEG